MPHRIAVLGASTNPSKFGNKCVRAYLSAGWEVLPVNPGAAEVEGQRAYASLGDVPGELERISVYLPPAVTRELLGDIASKGAGEVWLNPGAATPEVAAAAREMGLPVIEGCSIVAVGLSPSMFP